MPPPLLPAVLPLTVLLVSVAVLARDAAAVDAGGVAADGAVGQRRRAGEDAAAVGRGRVAADGAVGQRRRGGRDAAADVAGDVAPDRAVLDGEQAGPDDAEAAAVAARDVAGHGGADQLDVARPGRGPRWRCRRRSRRPGSRSRRSRGPPGRRSPTRMPPPWPVTFPLRTVSLSSTTLIDPGAVPNTSKTRSSCWPSMTVRPAPAPRIVTASVMSKSPVSVGVLARPGEGDLVDAGRQDDHVRPGEVVGRGDGLAERALAVGGVDHVERGGDVERGRDRAVFQALQAQAAGASRAVVAVPGSADRVPPPSEPVEWHLCEPISEVWRRASHPRGRAQSNRPEEGSELIRPSW